MTTVPRATAARAWLLPLVLALLVGSLSASRDVRADTGMESQLMVASPPPQIALEAYGEGVALWGDHAIVADRYAEHLGNTPGGASFAFERNGGSFVMQQLLQPVNADEHPNGAVAIDGNTAMVRRVARLRLDRWERPRVLDPNDEEAVHRVPSFQDPGGSACRPAPWWSTKGSRSSR